MPSWKYNKIRWDPNYERRVPSAAAAVVVARERDNQLIIRQILPVNPCRIFLLLTLLRKSELNDQLAPCVDYLYIKDDEFLSFGKNPLQIFVITEPETKGPLSLIFTEVEYPPEQSVKK